MSWRDWFTTQAKRVELRPKGVTIPAEILRGESGFTLGEPSNFERAFASLMVSEGGYVNDPNDPGGETKYGISKKAYPELDIASLTAAQAREIYRRDYWNALELDSRPRSEALCLFDSAVNHGVARTKQLAAVVARGPSFVEQFQAERALFYARLETWPIYGRGWMRRLIRTAIEASK